MRQLSPYRLYSFDCAVETEHLQYFPEDHLQRSISHLYIFVQYKIFDHVIIRQIKLRQNLGHHNSRLGRKELLYRTFLEKRLYVSFELAPMVVYGFLFKCC